MTQLFAQPHDIDASGFYFESLEEYQVRSNSNFNRHGDRVEEYEIQFISGEDIDCALAIAWGVNQANIGPFFEICNDWDDCQKQTFIIAVGEGGYGFNPDNVHPDEFDVTIYNIDCMRDLAEQFVDEGLFGKIPENVLWYLDYDAIACDLEHDFTLTEIAGETLIYRLA